MLASCLLRMVPPYAGVHLFNDHDMPTADRSNHDGIVRAGKPLTAAQHELLLSAVTAFLSSVHTSLRAQAARHVLVMSQRLLDSDKTTAVQLGGYFDLMQAAVAACQPSLVGPLLPDALDLFLGWALDPSTSPAHRCELHREHRIA